MNALIISLSGISISIFDDALNFPEHQKKARDWNRMGAAAAIRSFNDYFFVLPGTASFSARAVGFPPGDGRSIGAVHFLKTIPPVFPISGSRSHNMAAA